MYSIPYTNIEAQDDLQNRAELLFTRLEEPMYQPAHIFTVESGGWPGDWEGRTILALTMLTQITGREPAYLDEIVAKLEDNVNEKGYLRQMLPDGDVDEQQLSGHSWLLRGLCEYYLLHKEDTSRSLPVLHRIEAIVQNLFLPATGRYIEYPIRPEDRVTDGKESGHIGKKVGHWYLSSDTGCAYIPLDGLSQAYVLLAQESDDTALVERLQTLLREMVTGFYAIPFLEISVQTHATLTGCRGILRLYEQDKDPEKLAFVEKIFALYQAEGMTANYANYNWFGRPEWTEPCAVIDSFMVAAQLFQHTAKPEYAALAQRILYNGLYAGERANGGFGTDTCLGAAEKPDSHILACSSYEAYWCCSMRGGEGLAAVSRYSLLEQDEHTAWILYPVSGIYTVCGVKLRVDTKYPLDDTVTIHVLENPQKQPLTLRMQDMPYVTPQCVHSWDTQAIPQVGETQTWHMQSILHTEAPVGNHAIAGSILYYGNMILGTGKDTWDLKPLMLRYQQTAEEIQSQKLRIIF